MGQMKTPSLRALAIVEGVKLSYLTPSRTDSHSSPRLHPDIADVEADHPAFGEEIYRDRARSSRNRRLGNSCVWARHETSATRIHALAKSLGVEKASVVGHDIGLMVAYAYAAQFPAETRNLF